LEIQKNDTQTPPSPVVLIHQVGVGGATMMGLGSIIGSGVFVSIGIGAGVAGPAVLLAIVIAGLVAVCNGLSSAQLAANHPVSGGSYEYGYRWLTPSLGFTAGWMFLCAKSASAATAALGLAGYSLNVIGVKGTGGMLPIAMGVITLVTILVMSGLRRSNHFNIAVVSVTLGALVWFVGAGVSTAYSEGMSHWVPFFDPMDPTVSGVSGLLHACALMFVAYTGYGRIATMAEEVHHPRRTIPLAIILTLVMSIAIYVAVGVIAIAAVGSKAFARAGNERAAPLELVAGQFDLPAVTTVVAIGAVTAMLGVLINLVLGLSRVILAMGRRGDLPPSLGRLNRSATTPYRAVMLTGVLIGGLALIGDVKTTWSFSAFTVLIYYAITNLAAIRLSEQQRLYPAFIPWLGLGSCLFLAFWVEPLIWMSGSILIVVGLLWHCLMCWINSGRLTNGEPPAW